MFGAFNDRAIKKLLEDQVSGVRQGPSLPITLSVQNHENIEPDVHRPSCASAGRSHFISSLAVLLRHEEVACNSESHELSRAPGNAFDS